MANIIVLLNKRNSSVTVSTGRYADLESAGASEFPPEALEVEPSQTILGKILDGIQAAAVVAFVCWVVYSCVMGVIRG